MQSYPSPPFDGGGGVLPLCRRCSQCILSPDNKANATWSYYWCCIAIINYTYTYTYTCRNILNTITTSEDTSLEKYTSHFIWKGSKGLLKVLLCERWVGDWTELQHIDPHSYGHNSVSFPFSWTAQPGAWGPSLSGTWSSFQHLLSNTNCSIGGPEGPLCWVLVLSTTSYLQLTWTSCAPSYIIVLHPLNSTCRQSRLSPWYLRPDAPVIYTGAFPILTARSGSICNTE